MLVRMFLFTV